ncbi:DUF2155 domain-containing protein [Pseudodonghicola xiamenensis]|uniref:DUF2155 domain-containing protein n=1 Tax=Pseudodonghicola xiamenensis TaxID=337702 RepID=UPI0004899ABD|nr:DUF2155 domain-containing protein [Pseudodonghicola xiamenensis]
MKALAVAVITALSLASPLSAQDRVPASVGQGAVLRGLDKVNGQTVDIELKNGSSGEVFGLDVALAECRFPTENPTGDAFAYVTISDHGQPQFEGWMIASAPALNALDHPRYDVWVLRCITS